MATIDELLKSLEDRENGAEIIEVVKNLQQEISKKNNEAKNLRERAKNSESSNVALTEKFNKLLAREGIELGDDDDFDGVLDAHYAKKSVPAPAEQAAAPTAVESRELAGLRADMAKLTREMEKYKKTAEEAVKSAAEEKSRRITAQRDRQIVDALTKGKAITPSMTAKIFNDRVRMLDDESLVCVGEDGNDVTLDEGVAQFLKEYPQFAENHQHAGSGGGGRGGKGTQVFTREQIAAMTPEDVLAKFEKGELKTTLQSQP